MATRMSRSLTNAIIRSGFHPISVMLDNMEFWHNGAQDIKRIIEDMLKKPMSLAHREKLVDLLVIYTESRTHSQTCAKDLAPFIHPRFASITVTPDTSDSPLADASDEALAEIAALGTELAKRRGTKVLEHKPPNTEG